MRIFEQKSGSLNAVLAKKQGQKAQYETASQKKELASIETPLGKLIVAISDQGIEGINYCDEKNLIDYCSDHQLIQQLEKELDEFFKQKRRHFTLPLVLSMGTSFQQRVWQATRKIPYGETVSYGFLAQKVGSPKAARAVGMALHCNPISILVPCHRVLAKSGELTGYAGGLWRKEHLLALEKEGEKAWHMKF